MTDPMNSVSWEATRSLSGALDGVCPTSDSRRGLEAAKRASRIKLRCRSILERLGALACGSRAGRECLVCLSIRRRERTRRGELRVKRTRRMGDTHASLFFFARREPTYARKISTPSGAHSRQPVPSLPLLPLTPALTISTRGSDHLSSQPASQIARVQLPICARRLSRQPRAARARHHRKLSPRPLLERDERHDVDATRLAPRVSIPLLLRHTPTVFGIMNCRLLTEATNKPS